jgi:hypothetical protein
MVLRTSNAPVYTILDPLPIAGIGWVVEVHDFQGTGILARFADYKGLSFEYPLNDTGVGEVVLDPRDPQLTNPLPNNYAASRLTGQPNYWKVFEDGVERFRFIQEGRDYRKAEESDELLVAYTGRGVSCILEWGTILPATWGVSSTVADRRFVGRSWAYVYLTLLDEAKARGAIPSWVQPTFTTTTDSNGAAWTDSGDYTIPPGGNLLDLLGQMSEQHGIEWKMRPAGYLDAAPLLGTVKSSTVRFFEGVDIWSAGDVEDRADVRTKVFAEGADGEIRTASAPSAAVTTWGARETYVEAGDVDNAQPVANTTAAAASIARTSRTFQVAPRAFHPDTGADVDGKRVFEDYTVGDTIGYGPVASGGAADYRLRSIAIEVDDVGLVTLEITVDSRSERLIAKLQRRLARLLGGATGGAGGSTMAMRIRTGATIAAQTLNLGDLANVNVASVTDKALLLYDNATSKWIADHPSIDVLGDVATSGAAVDDLLMWTGSLWAPTNASVLPGGGSGLSWTQETNNALTSTSGLVTSTGTWTIASGQLQCVPSGTSRCVVPTALTQGTIVIIEAEVELPGSFSAMGVILSTSAAGTGGYSFRFNSVTQIRMEKDGTQNLGDATIASVGTGWHKLRMVIFGDNADGYIDGVKAYSGAGFAGVKANVLYPGVLMEGGTGRFRNLKAWTADLNLPA